MTAEIIQFNTPAEPDPKCSFCQITKSKSKQMFSNKRGKYVCDKCVAKCKSLMTSTISTEQPTEEDPDAA